MTTQRRRSPDTLNTLADLSARLGQATPANFPSVWLRRACSAEFARLTIEDAYADPSSAPYERAHAALTDLMSSEDWLSPKLMNFLTAVHELGVAPVPHRHEVETVITDDRGEQLSVLEWRPESDVPMTVSNAYAHAVQVIERSLAEPRYCSRLTQAFAGRIKKIQQTTGATGLLFVEKEAGPVGAIAMLSSLVEETGLPATVFRESRWAEPFAGRTPAAGEHLIVVYDLIVTGAGIVRAADALERTVDADCVGAVVLRGYGPQRTSVRTANGNDILLEALGWDPRIISPDRAAFDGVNQPVERGVPPGTYTRETLPTMSLGAQRILARLKARPRAGERESSADIVRRRQPESVVGLRPTEALVPSVRDALGEHLGPATPRKA